MCSGDKRRRSPATVRLAGEQNFTTDYHQQVHRLAPGALMSVNFTTNEPLKSFGAMVFGKTMNHRPLEVINFTDTCPEMAPPGWHLYLGWGLPKSRNGDYDNDAELALLLEDTRILSTSVSRGDWPAQHALSGTDLLPATPIPNLRNVGDGVKDYGDDGHGMRRQGGQQGCRRSSARTRPEFRPRQRRGLTPRTSD